MLDQQPLNTAENRSDLLAETAANVQIRVRLSKLQFLEKDLIQMLVVVLTCVYEHVVRQAVEHRDYQAESDDLRPCAQNGHDFHRRNSPSGTILSSTMSLRSRKRAAVSFSVIGLSEELNSRVRQPLPV